MTEAARLLVTDVLAQLAAASPSPRTIPELARSAGAPEEHVAAVVQLLLDERIVAGTDLGVKATVESLALMQDPAAREYFCAEIFFALPGEVLTGNLRQQQAVANTFRQPATPWFNRAVLWANLLVFGAGLFLASQQKALFDFLMPFRFLNAVQVAVVQNRAVHDALERTGDLRREHLVRGEWWRLLSCCFVHFGIIHLAMNLLALRVVGADIERMWGRWRYLGIYLLAGWGGSCAAIWKAPAIAGASGALCGLIGAEAVWLLLNRRYLPKGLARRAMFHLILTAALITLISLSSVVSGMGHLGGAVIGILAALLFHLERFGNAVARVLACLLLLAMPLACVLMLQRTVMQDPGWQVLAAREERRQLEVSLEEMLDLDTVIVQFQAKQLQPLLDRHHSRRDPALVQQALAELPALSERCRQLTKQLEELGPLKTEGMEQRRRAGQDYFEQVTELLEKARVYLQEKKTWRQAEEQLKDRVDASRKRWQQALRQR